MRSILRLLREPIVGCLLVALGLAHPARAAEPISLRVEVYGFAGMHILTLQSRIDERANRYTITTEFATAGVAGLVVELTSRSHVEGHFDGTPVQPESFRKDDRRNGVERHSRVTYRADGFVDGDSTPPPPTPIPPVEMANTVDNLTAYFRLERKLAKTGSCALSVRVFDGRHRYDLIFRDSGKSMLSSSGGQRFSGEAIACQMERRNFGVPDGERDEGARGGTIWYARLLPGEFMVPVRMELETQLGTVDGYLAELHGRGVDLQLMQ